MIDCGACNNTGEIDGDVCRICYGNCKRVAAPKPFYAELEQYKPELDCPDKSISFNRTIWLLAVALGIVPEGAESASLEVSDVLAAALAHIKPGTPGLEERDPALCNYPALPRLASVRREVGMGMEELVVKFDGWADPGSVFQALAHPDQRAPLDMVLYCPCCGSQHIDAPEEDRMVDRFDEFKGMHVWDNPPHRSHLCKYCGNVWRPADVSTNGVKETRTKGQRDTWNPERAAQICEEVAGKSRNSLFRSAAKICAGEIRRSPGHVTASAAACKWNYDMSTCPVGAKVQLLNLGGVACYGPVTERDRKYFAAWAPLLQRDKDEEKRRGLHI